MKTEEMSSQAPSPENIRAGEQLRQLRQGKSLSLDEVAAATKISRANLLAIETMTYDQLPADSFTRGQIVLYGAYLGIDGRPIAELFFTERDGGRKPHLSALQKSLHNQPLTPKTLAEPTHISSASLAVVLLLLIVCSFTAFCIYFSWNPFAVLTEKIFNLSPKNTLFHPADPATGNGGVVRSLKLDVVFHKDSRILLSMDNKPAVELSYSKGTEARWEADKHIDLEFFQPDSAEIRLNGTTVPFPNNIDGHYRLRLPNTP